MIFIRKNPEPSGLRNYKEEKQRNGETPIWKEFSEAEEFKAAFEKLRIALVKEQRFVCCYCQQEIAFKAAETGKLLMKTEHFLPKRGKHAVPEMQLDYGNLLAVCLGNSDNKEQEKHCDSHKLEKILQIIPNPSNGRQKDFRPFLKYKVQPIQKEVVVLPLIDDKLMVKDINLLNLNEQSLRSKRFSAWESVSRQIKKKDGALKAQRIKELLEIYTPAEQKEYKPFCDFIASWLKEHLRQLEAG